MGFWQDPQETRVEGSTQKPEQRGLEESALWAGVAVFLRFFNRNQLPGALVPKVTQGKRM